MNDVAAARATCDYCGLPLPGFRRVANSPPQDTAPAYCCLGCRLAAAIVAERQSETPSHGVLTRLGLAVFFAMNVMVFTMALWSLDVYEPGEQLGASLWVDVLRYLAMIFSIPVLLLLGLPLFEHAWDRLRRGEITTDLLLAVGVAAAFGFSFVSTLRDQGHIYFEVGCVVLVAVTLGRWLEAIGKQKSLDALRSLERLLPEQVRRIDTTSGGQHETCLPIHELARGDIFRVLPGERLPADGVIVRREALLDEQMVTGESRPTLKHPGETVFAGSLNLDGDVLITATAPASEGALQRIIDAVCAAASARCRVQQLADRVARVFTPAVIVIALAAGVAHGVSGGGAQGLMTALAVLLIACPCALGVAAPLAIWAAVGRAARHGVLFRDGDALTQLAGVRAVFFDKTGTLTTGRPQVAEFVTDSDASREETLAAAVALASASTHHLSGAVRDFANRSGLRASAEVFNLQNLPGQGLLARLAAQGETYVWGSPRLMAAQALTFPPTLQTAVQQADAQCLPVACLGWSGQVRGVFLFREELRPDASAVLQALSQQHLQPQVLTGDRCASAAALGHALGVPVQAELLPEDKLLAIRQARHEYGRVAMVGDGLNDAPALAEASVGIAMGCGADVSRETADVCLLSDDLARLPWAISLARQATRTIRQNLFWAFAYNVVGVALAATGRLNPMWAAAAMVVSSVFVISNSLRLGQEPTDALETAAALPTTTSVPGNQPGAVRQPAPVGPAWPLPHSTGRKSSAW